MSKIIAERDILKGLPPKGNSILVAVSGGPDSMALLHLLWCLQKKWNYTVYAAHIHHGLREGTADEDERFVREWCHEKQIPLFTTRLRLKEVLKAEGANTQDGARRYRYHYLRQVMTDYDIAYLATGHHADDQLETALMKQVDGRAVLGELGMAFSRPFGEGTLIRPLLAVTKEQIISYCKEHEISYQHDESNTSDKYTRNRFRHHVLPFLKEENHAVNRHIQQFVEWTLEERRFLEQQAEQEMNKVIDERHELFVTMRISRLLSLPLALQRRGIPLILSYLCKGEVSGISVLHIDQLIERICQKDPSFSLDWPGGVKVSRSYDSLRFSVADVDADISELYSLHLPLPGQVSFSHFEIRAEREYTAVENLRMFRCKEEDVALPFIVRSLRDGDRIQPYGMAGRKKVSRLFIDEKIPRHDRERWPIVTDANGVVIWVPMLRKSAFHVKEPQAGVSYITVYCERK